MTTQTAPTSSEDLLQSPTPTSLINTRRSNSAGTAMHTVSPIRLRMSALNAYAEDDGRTRRLLGDDGCGIAC